MIKIGIIGPNVYNCSDNLYDFGITLGKKIATPERVFVCGGKGGFMEAVCKGVKLSESGFQGQTIGILPEDNDKFANPYIDIAIPTGIGIARNLIVINSSDIIIAAGGGSGTLSELAFAWQKNKKTLCVTAFDGWTEKLAGINIDKQNKNLFIPVDNIAEIKSFLVRL
jgi:uncharacterized protein (TIGR00725 family)